MLLAKDPLGNGDRCYARNNDENPPSPRREPLCQKYTYAYPTQDFGCDEQQDVTIWQTF